MSESGPDRGHQISYPYGTYLGGVHTGPSPYGTAEVPGAAVDTADPAAEVVAGATYPDHQGNGGQPAGAEYVAETPADDARQEGEVAVAEAAGPDDLASHGETAGAEVVSGDPLSADDHDADEKRRLADQAAEEEHIAEAGAAEKAAAEELPVKVVDDETPAEETAAEDADALAERQREDAAEATAEDDAEGDDAPAEDEAATEGEAHQDDGDDDADAEAASETANEEDAPEAADEDTADAETADDESEAEGHHEPTEADLHNDIGRPDHEEEPDDDDREQEPHVADVVGATALGLAAGEVQRTNERDAEPAPDETEDPAAATAEMPAVPAAEAADEQQPDDGAAAPAKEVARRDRVRAEALWRSGAHHWMGRAALFGAVGLSIGTIAYGVFAHFHELWPANQSWWPFGHGNRTSTLTELPRRGSAPGSAPGGGDGGGQPNNPQPVNQDPVVSVTITGEGVDPASGLHTDSPIYQVYRYAVEHGMVLRDAGSPSDVLVDPNSTAFHQATFNFLDYNQVGGPGLSDEARYYDAASQIGPDDTLLINKGILLDGHPANKG